MQYNFYILTSTKESDRIRYVGVTTKTLKQRFYQHKHNALRKNKSQPVHKWMYSHINDGYEINITKIDECDETKWEETEKYWISYYKEQGHDLLNISDGGCDVITKEMRKKNGIQRSIDAHKKAVYAIDPKTLEIVAEYDSIVSATKACGLKSKSAIGNVLNKDNKTAISGGYYWVWKSEYDSGNYNIKIKNEFAHISTPIVYRFDFQGRLIGEYNGHINATRALGLKSRRSMSEIINSKRIFHNSYWSYNKTIDVSEYENPYRYIEYNEVGNEICKYIVAEEISKVYGYSLTNISIMIKNGAKFGNNYIKKINKN